MDTQTKKKMVRLWEPLWTSLKQRAESSLLRRDAYLDKVFLHEARKLGEELEGRNSPEARAQLSKHLDRLKLVPTTLVLTDETSKAIETVCNDKNVPRDCFINRVIFFLAAKPDILKLVFPFDYEEQWQQVLMNEVNEFMYPVEWGALGGIEELVNRDPFWGIRACIDSSERSGDGLAVPLHQMLIPEKLLAPRYESLLGLNCHLNEPPVGGLPVDDEQPLSLNEIEFDEVLKNIKIDLAKGRKP